MTQITSYVFFDIETTGLPFQERNKTKIIEVSFLAVLRKDIEDTQYGSLPPISKLTFVLNPQKRIHPEVVQLTGLSNKLLRYAPYFNQKFASIYSFLEDLPKPVCLIAHNGNSFDFKILLAECSDARVTLPKDLLCCDSLIGFRKILKQNSELSYKDFAPAPQKINGDPDIFTDDEDDWPNLNVSQEQWNEIDDICTSLSDISTSSDSVEVTAACVDTKQKKIRNEALNKRRDSVIKTVLQEKSNGMNGNSEKLSFKLTDLYKKLFNKDEENAHRAEADCLMLLNCVIAVKHEFLQWSDQSCKLLTEIKPLQRYS